MSLVLIQGSMDDIGGVVVAWEALRLMKALGLTPRRTIRAVGWTNEGIQIDWLCCVVLCFLHTLFSTMMVLVVAVGRSCRCCCRCCCCLLTLFSLQRMDFVEAISMLKITPMRHTSSLLSLMAVSF